MSASSSDLNSRFDSLEQRMASFRARSKASSQASSTLNSTRVPGEEKEVVSAIQTTDHYDAFVTSISAANVVPSSRVRSGSVASPTGRGSRASSPGPRSGAVSPSAASPGRRGTVSLSNISRHDDGWTSNGEESTDLASQAAAKRRQMQDPSASPPASAGLVMAYKSDGEGSSNNGAMSSRRPAGSISAGVNSGELSARRLSKADQGTEHLQSWAEAQALAKAKEQALLSARRKREDAREAEMATREAEARENLRREREEATRQREKEQADARERQSQSAKDSSYLQSPLTARSRAAQEAQQSGYIVHANDSKEVLGALAHFEKKRQADESTKRGTLDGSAKALKPSASGKLTNRSSGGEMTNRDRRARAIDPNALDQDDASIYNNSTFVPSSARGTGSNTSRSQAGTARGQRSVPGVGEVKDRRQEVLDRKEKARQRRELALAAITLASTPVEQGGTLVVDPNNPNYPNVAAALATSRKSKEGSSTSRRGSMTARSRQRMREKLEGSSSSKDGHHHHHHHHPQTEGGSEGQQSTGDSHHPDAETNDATANGDSTNHPRPHEERKCEMLDFKGVGEKQCVIQ